METVRNRPPKNRRGRRHVEAGDLEKGYAGRHQHGMPQVRRKEGAEDQTLDGRISVLGQQAIKQDLPLRERAGEYELDVRRLEHQAPLHETLEHRATEHDPGPANRNLRPQYLAEDLVSPEIKQAAGEARGIDKADQYRGPPQRSATMPDAAPQQGPPEIKQGAVHPAESSRPVGFFSVTAKKTSSSVASA